MKNPSAKTVFVTGASSGIGRDIADRLVASGYNVCGASRNIPEEVSHPYYRMDVTDRKNVFDTVEQIVKEHDRIDILIHSAGTGLIGPVETCDIESAKQQMNVNFWGTVHVLQAVLPRMRENQSGRIIVIGSIAGLMGLPYMPYYSTSKFGLEALVESLRIEIKNTGVQACIINPGDINTEMIDHHQYSAPPKGSFYEQTYERMARLFEDNVRNGTPVHKVSQTIMKAIQAKRMKHRYIVGSFTEHVAYWGKRLLPEALFENLFGKFFKL